MESAFTGDTLSNVSEYGRAGESGHASAGTRPDDPAALPTSPPPPQARDAPVAPDSLAETGLGATFVQDLLLKVVYTQGARTGQQIAETVRLPLAIVDEQLLDLQHRRLMEVRGTSGHGRGGFLFELTGMGRERAQEALGFSRYVGPAPVPIEHYRRWLEAQTIRDVNVTRARIADGFSGIVVDPQMLEALGPAINSGKSLFLYGESGNGKTLIAESIADLLGGSIYVPFAVAVDGQVLLVHDPVYHRPAEGSAEEGLETASLWRSPGSEHDRRYARVRRPVVVAGGELTLGDLDLRYDPLTKVYEAPFQVKANGGVLIIDDFGRQRVPPRDLLNRWIVPLEKRRDFLTLHTGGKFPVPFDCLLIFATNLDPRTLAEEAFLRRIHYKVQVRGPSRGQYAEIFRRCCAARGIEFTEDGVRHVYEEYYSKRGIPARSCHPRDILDHLVDVARFMEVEPRLTGPLLDRACDSYFLSIAKLAETSDATPGW
jgi:predicted ATPase with chaperone activity